jgi:hypothetical protein
MGFSNLSDAELEFQIRAAVTEENKAKTRVLHLLAEVERRRLYSKEYPSLFEYCVRVLKYSSGAAQRRIDTMRAMKLIPEIEEKLISGELNLTSVSQAQSFFRHEAKQEKPYSLQEKKILLEKLENKSTRECIETLISISPNTVPQEKRRELTPHKTELKLTLDKKIVEKLDRLKALMSHRNPHMTDGELIDELVDMALQKLDPSLKQIKVKSPLQPKSAEILNEKISLPAPEVKETEQVVGGNVSKGSSVKTATPSRYVPAPLKRAIWMRDQGRCSFKDCGSRYFLEIDHIKPMTLGGTTELPNLRLLCRAHNQRAAIESLGFKRMDKFINRSVPASSD